MKNTLEKRLEQVKNYSESAHRRASLYCDIMKINDKKTSQSLNALQNAPSPGKKLQKIGFIMLWIPEPTGVTCAIGGPMILAGRYLDKKYNSSTISDVNHHTKNVTSTIDDFKSSIM